MEHEPQNQNNLTNPKWMGLKTNKIANSAALARKFEQNLVSNEFISVKLTP